MAGVLIALVAVSGGASPAAAHLSHSVDDGCELKSNDPFFAALGPEDYFFVHAGEGVGCHIWTWTITATSYVGSINIGEWYLPAEPVVCTGYVHDFYVLTWMDTDAHWEAQNARYRRFRAGHAGGITETYTLDQPTSSDGLVQVTNPWDHFKACDGGFMGLGDGTGIFHEDMSFDYMFFDPISH